MNDEVLYEAGFSFEVTPLGLRVDGSPSQSEWAEVGLRLADARNGTLWAIGDWLLYAETRGFSDGAVEAAASATGLKRQTLWNCKRVSKAIPLHERHTGLSWSHHQILASCEPEVRARLTTIAADEHLTVEDLVVHVKEIKHHVAQQMQSFPAGTFGLLYAQPPWYGTPGVDTMTTDQLSSLAPQVQQVAAPDCVLYLRAPDAAVVSGEALAVVRAWGFTPQAMHVWVRDIGEDVNTWMRTRHAHVLVATRGTPVPPRSEVLPDSVLVADIPGDGSGPSELLDLCEAAYPEVPRLALFARETESARLLSHDWMIWRAALPAAPQHRQRGVRLRDEPTATVKM